MNDFNHLYICIMPLPIGKGLPDQFIPDAFIDLFSELFNTQHDKLKEDIEREL